MNVCKAPLAFSFAKPLWELLLTYGFGLVGILGFGLGVEFLIRKRWRTGFGASRAPLADQTLFTHAFLEGTVVLSYLLLLLSLLSVGNHGILGFVWPLATLGWVVGGVSVWRIRQRRPDGSTLSASISGLKKWEWALLFLLIGPTAFHLVSAPIGFSDTTSIWAYHSKELSCFPLFNAPFVREKVWTGTHPEYPLFLPFLHAYFFSLGDSFRDDWVKSWQSVSFACAVIAAYSKVRTALASRLTAFAILMPFLALASGFFTDGRVELNSAIFVWMASIALIQPETGDGEKAAGTGFSADLGRFSIYLAGFLFCKNECFVGSLLLAGSAGLMSFANFNATAQNNFVQSWLQKAKSCAFLLPWLGAVSLWIVVMRFLPSLHEQYPKRLISFDAWKNGIPNISYIIHGCLSEMKARIFRPIFFAFPLFLAFLVFGFLLQRRLRENLTAKTAGLLLFWGISMLGVFLAVYIVSPFGKDLYAMTFVRLFSELFPAISVGMVLVFWLLSRKRNPDLPIAPRLWSRTLGVILQCGWILYFGVSVKRDSIGFLREYRHLVRENKTEISAYHADAEWKTAFEFDRELPPASRGAFLHPKGEYYTLNYLLFPRLLYPAAPNIIAGTTVPWPVWNSPQEVPLSKLGFEFIVDDEKVIYVRPP